MSKTARLFVRIPPELHDEIRRLAAWEFLTPSEYVRKVLAEAVIKARKGQRIPAEPIDKSHATCP